jgi:uncharacterized protein (TIGR03083 family)
MKTLPTARYLKSLDSDYRRLLDLAGDDLTVTVPTCPEWTLTDLVEHVAMVYLHKAETMRRGAFPDPWPPQDHEPEVPAAFLQRAYAALTAEFAARSPEDPSPTWFAPNQTVGFWFRRMAHESVIHRVDAELAAGVERAPIPGDIAVDGIDELLTDFLAYASVEWRDSFEGALPSAGERALIRAGDAAWLVTLGDTVTVTEAAGDTAADVTLVGDPAAVLLWAWRRADADSLAQQGKPEVASKLRDFLRIATQ